MMLEKSGKTKLPTSVTKKTPDANTVPKRDHVKEFESLIGEPVIKDYECARKVSGSTYSGTLFITQRWVCFSNHATTFRKQGFKCTMQFEAIIGIQKKNKVLLITNLNKSFKQEIEKFGYFENIDEVEAFLIKTWHQARDPDYNPEKVISNIDKHNNQVQEDSKESIKKMPAKIDDETLEEYKKSIPNTNDRKRLARRSYDARLNLRDLPVCQNYRAQAKNRSEEKVNVDNVATQLTELLKRSEGSLKNQITHDETKKVSLGDSDSFVRRKKLNHSRSSSDAASNNIIIQSRGSEEQKKVIIDLPNKKTNVTPKKDTETIIAVNNKQKMCIYDKDGQPYTNGNLSKYLQTSKFLKNLEKSKPKFPKPDFEKEFKLNGQTVSQSFVCSLKISGGVSVNGVLFLTQDYLCFANYQISFVKINHKVIIKSDTFIECHNNGRSIIITRLVKAQKEIVEFTDFLEDIQTSFLQIKKMCQMVPRSNDTVVTFSSDDTIGDTEPRLEYITPLSPLGERYDDRKLKRLESVVTKIDHFTIEHSQDKPDRLVLESTDNIYTKLFINENHSNFICINNQTGAALSILSVLDNPNIQTGVIPESEEPLHALLTEKNGVEELYFTKWSLKKGGGSIDGFMNKIAMQFCTFYRVNDKQFINDFALFCTSHLKPVKTLKVGVLYVLPGQTNLREIFQNRPPADSSFWKFMQSIATKVNLKGWKNYIGDFGQVEHDSYYTVWSDLEIMFHVAPWLSSDQHRQLIGNDICFIVYYDSQNYESFNPTAMAELGIVPQVFTVVRPFGSKYRLGFFNRSNLKHYPPNAPPRDYEFSGTTIKDYLFTKLHNGYVMSTKCPPMNRLFATPRNEAMKELVRQYPRDKKSPTPTSSRKAKPRNQSISSPRDFAPKSPATPTIFRVRQSPRNTKRSSDSEELLDISSSPSIPTYKNDSSEISRIHSLNSLTQLDYIINEKTEINSKQDADNI